MIFLISYLNMGFVASIESYPEVNSNLSDKTTNQNISRNSVISDIVPAFFVYCPESSAGIWIVWSECYICLRN